MSGKVLICYFSGTGGTARAADEFEKEFASRGFIVDKQRIKTGTQILNGNENLLILLFAVHAANAPKPVYRWADGLSPVNGIPAVVISVSGGGEVFPNTACRRSSIKRLERKGYRVFYEHMLIMPSNMSIATPDFLSEGLIKVLPSKVRSITGEVISGLGRRTRPTLIDRFLSVILEIEKTGAGQFGKRLYASEACTGCGWCEKNCPGANIHITDGKPVFGKSCVLCFGCVYGCPENAIRAKMLGFLLNKDGFSISEIEKLHDIPEQKTGAAWKAVRRYIEQEEI